MKSVKFSAPRTHLSPRKQPPCWTWRFQANFQHLPLGPMKPWQAENGWHQGHDEIVAKSGFVKWMPDSHGFTPTKNPGKKSQPCPPNHHQPPTSMPLPSSASASEPGVTWWCRDVVMSWCCGVGETELETPGIAAPIARKLGERHKAAKVPNLPPVVLEAWKLWRRNSPQIPVACTDVWHQKQDCIFNSDSKLESTNPILTTKQFTPGSGKKTRRVSLRSRTKLWSAAWKNPVSWLGWASAMVVASESPRQWKAPLLISTGMPGRGVVWVNSNTLGLVWPLWTTNAAMLHSNENRQIQECLTVAGGEIFLACLHQFLWSLSKLLENQLSQDTPMLQG